MEVVTGTVETEGIKRCYVPGAIFKRKCTKCDSDMEFDCGNDYFGYPKNGGEETIYFYCDKCDSEYVLPVKFECEVKLTVCGDLKRQ